MHNIYLVLFSVVCLGFSACNSAKTASGEVNFIASPEPGTVMVSTGGYGPTKPLAIKNAESNAFSTLIFKGIPGSSQQLPMVPDERGARKMHGAYFDELLNGGYKVFMMASDSQSSYAAGRRKRPQFCWSDPAGFNSDSSTC